MSSAAPLKNESRQTRRKALLRLVSHRLCSFSQRDGPVNLLLIHREEEKNTGLAFLNQTPASFLGTAPPDWGRGGWRRINHCLFPRQLAAGKSPHTSRHTQGPAAYLLLRPPYPSVFSRWPPALSFCDLYADVLLPWTERQYFTLYTHFTHPPNIYKWYSLELKNIYLQKQPKWRNNGDVHGRPVWNRKVHQFWCVDMYLSSDLS